MKTLFHDSSRQDIRALKIGVVLLTLLTLLATFFFWKAWDSRFSSRAIIERDMETVVVIDAVSANDKDKLCVTRGPFEMQNVKRGKTYRSKLHLMNQTANDLNVKAATAHIIAQSDDQPTTAVYDGEILVGQAEIAEYSITVPADYVGDSMRSLVQVCTVALPKS